MISEASPICIAKSLILDRDGRVLVLRRSDTDDHRPGGADIPGGEADLLSDGMLETPMQAAIREAYEEAGIILLPEQMEEVVTMSDQKKNGHVLRRCLFLAQLAIVASDVSIVLDPKEHSSYDWVEPETLPERFQGTHWLAGIVHLLDETLGDAA